MGKPSRESEQEDHGVDLPSAELIDARDAMAQISGNAEEVVERYSHCPVCGSRLHFTHLTDFSRNLTQETANCPECTIKVRRVMHRLQ